MPSRKSSRSYFEYTLKKEHKEKIMEIINAQFDKFLKHNFKSISNKDREHLRRLAIDQLSEYMSELSDEKTRWNLDGSVITIRIQSKLENVNKRLIQQKSDKVRNTYRFIQRSNKWEMLIDKEAKVGISYDEFSKVVYDQMFSAAGTAAFYAIESWFREGR